MRSLAIRVPFVLAVAAIPVTAGPLCSVLNTDIGRYFLRIRTWIGCQDYDTGTSSEVAPESVCMLAYDVSQSTSGNDSSSIEHIIGVPPAMINKFGSSFKNSSFTCFDGSSQIPFQAVNDEFCDCLDGSDEPGTAACAERSGRCFFCMNVGSTAKFIYASRVGDGICDCCDGSDERGTDSNICSDLCEKEGADFRATQEKKKLDILEGLKILEVLRQTASNASSTWESEHSELELKMSSLEGKRKEAQEFRDSIQEKVDEEQRALEAIKEAETRNRTEAEVYSNFSELPEEVTDTMEANGPELSAETTTEPQVSEYAKWALDQKQEESALKLDDDEIDEQETKDDSVNTPEAQTELERELAQAKVAFDGADEAVREARRIRDNLAEKMKLDLGDELRWFSLADKCVEKVEGEYRYNICFFKDAHQDYTRLGSFDGWDPANPFVMVFNGGAPCHGGPSRSLRAMFECGSTEEIVGISEPSKCVYEARVTHPAACRPEDIEQLESASNSYAMPHLEL